MEYRTHKSTPCCFGNALHVLGPRYDRSVGTHVPTCFGCCLLSSDVSNNTIWVTFLLLFVPALAWELGQKRADLENLSKFAPVVVYLELAFVCVFLLFTWLTEPGIVETVSYTLDSEEPVEHVQIVLYRSTLVDLTALRAKFSRYTSNCVEEFDHFCPWVGNAVGVRNYRYFYAFIVSCLALAGTVAGLSVVVLVDSAKESSAWDAIRGDPVASVVGAYCGFMAFSLVWLVGLHTYAISTNLTTNEII